MTRKLILSIGSMFLGLLAGLSLPGCDSDSLVLGSTATPGVLKIQATTESLGAPARIGPGSQQAPDDVDVNLTPTAFAIAFKRLVIKQVDEETGETLAEVELFSTDTMSEAMIVDLVNSQASDLIEATDLPAGTYNKMDIEVFYMDMTVATLYPGTESHDIAYRMVYEDMGLLEARDLLLYLEPAWMSGYAQLAAQVAEAGFYWMSFSDPDAVQAVDGAVERPSYHVLDLFANEEFWSSEHKVLEGGTISPPLEYDPEAGGILTIEFGLEGKFNFKDYHDEVTEADGLWEIRSDAGIHPFPPDFQCQPQS